MNKTAALAMGWGRLAFSDTENAGCPTVFLHGTGCDRADWQETFDGLSDKVRIIAPEFRGHGLSEVPRERFTLEDLVDDVLALVQALDLERPLFVGHSLGGMVAMALARKTENVAGLVLLEGWTALSCVGQAFNGDRMFGDLSSDEVKRIQSKSAKTKARFSDIDWQYFWESVKAFDARDFLKATDLPIWQVYGELGRTQESVRRLRVPDRKNIHWHWVNDTGHYLPHERPQKVAAVCHLAIEGLAHEIS